jgi:hypothetical protein
MQDGTIIGSSFAGKAGDMSLEKELETYRTKLHELNDHEGKFVLIQGDDVVDFFSTYEDAIKEGYQKFGLNPFLVKRVNSADHVQFISRFVAPRQVVSGLS